MKIHRWYLTTWHDCQWWIKILTTMKTFQRYEIDIRSNISHPYIILTTSYHPELIKQ